MLEEFVACGANAEILTRHHPHIGTFKLATVVRGLRARIEELGGEGDSAAGWSVCSWLPVPMDPSPGNWWVWTLPMEPRWLRGMLCWPQGIQLAIASPCSSRWV